MPDFNRYCYQPLSTGDAIRLIVLDPSTDESAPLTCQIIERRLTARNLDYSAVSYAWGKHDFNEDLQIRCEGDVKHLRITTNVAMALKGLRKHHEPRYLWIDVVCFDQENEAEKAHQIPMMGEIYKQAVAVEIWLGPEDDTTASVLTFFRKLSRIPDVTQWKTQWAMAGQIVVLMKEVFHQNAAKALDAIYVNFFRRPWFLRRWIIQEACLTRRGVVHCGKQTIALQSLEQAATRLQRMDISDYPLKVAANLKHEATKLTMLELLWHFHDSECLEPQDRIAAFLGLASDGRNFSLDYVKPWEDCFRDFASFAYNTGHNDTRLQLLLHLFDFGSVSKLGDSSFPSWVPDWSRPRLRSLPYISGFRNQDSYEPYPHSPGHSRKATVAFHRGCLQINADPLESGTSDLRIASAATFKSSNHAKNFTKRQVSDVFNRMFPHIRHAEVQIAAFTILLRTISDFRHSEHERKMTSKSLGRLETALRKRLRGWNPERSLIWLRTLESVLRDFCLVELKPIEQEPVATQGYGIGLEPMLPDDIVIPLWHLQIDDPESDLHIGVLDTSFQLFTSLAVRRHGPESRHDLDQGGPVQECKIVGPVICVTWTRAFNDSGCPSVSERSRVADLKHWSSIRIS